MATYQDVFKRYEKKYLLHEKQYQAVLHELSYFMEADTYGMHTISNLYYDTDTYQIIRKSLQKPVYKEKFRIRAYGTPKADTEVFLELEYTM